MARRVFRATKEAALNTIKNVLIERKVRSPSDVNSMGEDDLKNTFKVELMRGGHDVDIDMDVDVVQAHRPAVEHLNLPDDIPAEAVEAALPAGVRTLPDILAQESEKRMATATIKDILLLRNVRSLAELNAMDANEVRAILLCPQCHDFLFVRC